MNTNNIEKALRELWNEGHRIGELRVDCQIPVVECHARREAHVTRCLAAVEAEWPRWIPVNANMPEDTTIMLYDGKEMWFGCLNREMGLVCYFGHGVKVGKEFTHWQQLPAAPEEQKEAQRGEG